VTVYFKQYFLFLVDEIVLGGLTHEALLAGILCVLACVWVGCISVIFGVVVMIPGKFDRKSDTLVVTVLHTEVSCTIGLRIVIFVL